MPAGFGGRVLTSDDFEVMEMTTTALSADCDDTEYDDGDGDLCSDNDDDDDDDGDGGENEVDPNSCDRSDGDDDKDDDDRHAVALALFHHRNPSETGIWYTLLYGVKMFRVVKTMGSPTTALVRRVLSRELRKARFSEMQGNMWGRHVVESLNILTVVLIPRACHASPRRGPEFRPSQV